MLSITSLCIHITFTGDVLFPPLWFSSHKVICVCCHSRLHGPIHFSLTLMTLHWLIKCCCQVFHRVWVHLVQSREMIISSWHKHFILYIYMPSSCYILWEYIIILISQCKFWTNSHTPETQCHVCVFCNTQVGHLCYLLQTLTWQCEISLRLQKVLHLI